MNLPAVCGIKNHGNTCFINSIIQCLSNVDVFAEYFVADHYKLDRKKHVKMHSKSLSFGSSSRGELCDSLSCLLKSLWTGRYASDVSFKFKSVISKHGAQYEGWDQHDAQEFLLWLLDRSHEELNIAMKGGSFSRASLPRTIRSSFSRSSLNGRHQLDERPDEEIAAETLENHLKRHYSFIHDIFQAQLKSCLTCRSCGKTSSTFDPFLCLSLPVPSNAMHSITVTVSFLDRLPKQVKMALAMESQSSLREVRDKISRHIQVKERNLVLLRLDNSNGLRELIRDTTPLQDLLHDLREILVVETPSLPDLSPNVALPSSLPTMSSCITLVLVNQEGPGSGQLFGPLFSCLISRDSSYFRIQMDILRAIRPIVRPTFKRNGILFKGDDTKLIDFSDDEERSRPSSPLSKLFRLRVVYGSSSQGTSSSRSTIPLSPYLADDVEHPLFMPIVDEATAFCEDPSYRGPLHLMLVVEWNIDARQQLLLDIDDISLPEEDPSINLANRHAFHVSLLDCLDLYFREEKLNAENAWMCPNCKSYQSSFKKLSLWSLPDVFIIHLKRFKQSSSSCRTKLSTAVDFPLTGLDMLPYLEERRPTLKTHVVRNGGHNYPSTDRHLYEQQRNSQYNSLPSHWSSRIRMQKLSQSSIYDVIGVCNHSGGLQSGHYTAVCKNPVDKHWYSFDDTKVYPVRENHVVSANAYILFYQRRVSASSSPSSTSSGYSSSGICPETDAGLHWIHRINKSNKTLGSLTPVLSKLIGMNVVLL